MTILAAADLGDLGAEQGKAVQVAWHWYYSAPALGLWGLLVGLLVIPRQNRKWQVWLVLVVPLLATLCRWLIPSDSLGLDVVVYLATTFPLAWTCVWLSAPYLSLETRGRAFGAAMGVLLGAGLIGYLGYCGLWWSSETGLLLIPFWIVPSIALVLASLLAGNLCRTKFSIGRFSLTFLIILPLVTVLIMVVGMGGLLAVLTGNLMIAISMVFMAGLASVIVSGVLCAVNLPMLLLSAKTDCYQERLQRLFCPGMAAPASSSGGNPFSESAGFP